MTKYPIFIPSKARSEKVITSDLLTSFEIEHFIVVEPQDEESYRKKYSNLLVMNQNDQGIAFARNFIKDWAKSNGFRFHWQIDDDMMRFKKRQENAFVDCSPLEMLHNLESIVDEYENLTIISPIDLNWALQRKEPISFNKGNNGCILTHSMDDIRWNFGLNEDMDYSLQHLFEGNCTARVNTYAFATPPTGRMKGGNQSCKNEQNSIPAFQVNLARKYPEFVRLVWKEKRGYPMASMNQVWKIFRDRVPSKKNQKSSTLDHFFM